jgi:hypothetical protein
MSFFVSYIFCVNRIFLKNSRYFFSKAGFDFQIMVTLIVIDQLKVQPL